jgi:hypothetical protein
VKTTDGGNLDYFYVKIFNFSQEPGTWKLGRYYIHTVQYVNMKEGGHREKEFKSSQK